MRVTVKVDGGEALAKNLDTLSLRVQKGIVLRALKVGAEPMRAAASAHAPKPEKAPHVGDHIVIGSARQKGVYASVAIGPSKGFDERAQVYPKQQEYGNARHKAQPFMRPAFDTEQARTLKIVASEVWGELIARGSSSGGGML